MNDIVKRIARKIAYSIAPKQVSTIQRYRYLRSEAKWIKKRASSEMSHRERFRKMQRSPFAAIQIESEFIQAMAEVEKLKPSTLVEIGAYQGGTLFLFAQVTPAHCRLLAIDIAFGPAETMAFQEFASRGQNVTCICGDSAHPEVRDKVREWLNGGFIDVLFIDGDHSYQGIRSDFELYGPMVRRGGLIFLHDIVEDYASRYGKPTVCYTGGVPKFWRELKDRGYQMEELIDNPDQDGHGVGILHVPS